MESKINLKKKCKFYHKNKTMYKAQLLKFSHLLTTSHPQLPDTTTDPYNLTEIPTTTPIPSASPPSSLPRPPPAYTSLLHMRTVRIAKSKRTIPILAGVELEDLEHPLAVATTARNETTNGTTSAKIRDVDVGLVQVRMQNTSVIDGGATRLIYTVHLGGKPVPAETAAKDMALLSAQEVALELGAPVLIQSEREQMLWSFSVGIEDENIVEIV